MDDKRKKLALATLNRIRKHTAATIRAASQRNAAKWDRNEALLVEAIGALEALIENEGQ